VANQLQFFMFYFRVSFIFTEICSISEVLVVAVEVSLIGVTSPGFVRALKVAEKVEILGEFFCRDLVLTLSPLLLYLLIEGILSASAAYLLLQWC
jgi:hypothetical protein